MLDEIPRGRKDGMYFLPENNANIEKRENGNKSSFWDDSGAWKNAKTPATHYLHQNGILRTIVKRENVYCSEKQVKRRIFIPLEAQSGEHEILEIHRLDQTLVASNPGDRQFKRKFTWIDNVPHTMPRIPTNVAIVEYTGDLPARYIHRSVKNKEKNTVYIRTKDFVMTELKCHLQHDTAKLWNDA